MSKPLSRKARSRLGRLADYMSRIRNPEHFNMGHFFDHEGQSFVDAHGGEVGDVLTLRDLHSCGTSACALGHACFAPGLKYMGLEYRIAHYPHDRPAPRIYYKGRRVGNYFKAAQDAFGLADRKQVEYLFGGHDDVVKTPQDWAKRCREFLAANGDLSLL